VRGMPLLSRLVHSIRFVATNNLTSYTFNVLILIEILQDLRLTAYPCEFKLFGISRMCAAVTFCLNIASGHIWAFISSCCIEIDICANPSSLSEVKSILSIRGEPISLYMI